MDDYDLTIIGGGVCGLVVASGASQLGTRVALIERETLGGDCLHYGCVPTKTLIHSAKIISIMKRAQEFGIDRSSISFDFKNIMKHMHEIMDKIGEHDDPRRFEQMGAKVIFGVGRFLDNRTIELNGQKIGSRRFVISTGSRPFVPDIPGLKEAGHLTNITALGLDHLPGSMAVLGGGPIGVEFAQIFSRFGARVIIIEKLGHILPREDTEITSILEGILKQEGIEILTCTDVNRIRVESGKKILLAKCSGAEKEISVDEILVSIGRLPNTEGLNLEAAGVEYTKKGIVTDQAMQTRAKNIWAGGDVVGPYQFTHMAEYHAGLIVGNSLFPFVRRKADFRVVPWVTFTDPELGRVGMTEAEAMDRYGGIKTYRFEFKGVDRAVIEGEGRGLIKIVCDKRQRILGAHILGPNAGDLIHEYILAMKVKLKITDISSAIHVYPTLSQGVKRACDQYYRERLFTGWFPRLAKRLIRMGG